MAWTIWFLQFALLGGLLGSFCDTGLGTLIGITTGLLAAALLIPWANKLAAEDALEENNQTQDLND